MAANDGSHQPGFGDDPYTEDAIAMFRAIFRADVTVAFVATGTAANALALASLSEPWQEIVCHGYGHHAESESTAAERMTHCRTRLIDTASDKLLPTDLRRVASGRLAGVHATQPGVVTVANPTEWGTVYKPDEMRALADAAHDLGYRIHVDGARFANAVASLSCEPREITQEAGVDALTFGGSKVGLAIGEAVVLFRQGAEEAYERANRVLPYHRKGTGHLVGKQRFLSAPFAAILRDSCWLKHATHANEMAALLANGLRQLGVIPTFAVETNQVFAEMPTGLDAHLRSVGHSYLTLTGPGSITLSRFVCSFDTSPQDVSSLLHDVDSWRSEST